MSEKTRRTIAKNLKQIRLRKGMTQADVAKKAGVSVNYYARIERADVRVSAEVVLDIVKALGAKSTDVFEV